MNLKIGDKVLRILPPSEHWHAFVHHAEVIEITKTTVLCTVVIDSPRRMEFNKDTGTNINKDFNDFIIRMPKI